MVQNLRAYFILYVITIKFMKCMQDRIEFSCMYKDQQSFTKYIETNASLRTILLSFVKESYLLFTNRPEC